MAVSPIQCSPPFCRAEDSAEKGNCCYYAEIAAFAIGLILLIAGALILTGNFFNLSSNIGWCAIALGIVGLAIGCVRCIPKKDDLSTHEDQNASFMSVNQGHFSSTQPTWQNNSSFVNPMQSGWHSQQQGSLPFDKQSVINRVMSDPNSFQNESYDLRNDEDVVAAALSGCNSPEQAKKIISNACYDAKNSKKVALALVRIDPTQFGQLNYDAKNNEDVVAAALSGCKSPEQAKKVISEANYDAKNSKKVALALVRIDPTQFGQLNYDAKNNEDVVVAALSGCSSLEQVKKVISNANYDAKNSKKVALALVGIDPTLIGQINYDAKNDLEVVFLAIKLSTEHTIDKIWSSIGINAALNKDVRAKVKEKYPNFFQQEVPSFNAKNAPNQTPQSAAQTRWVEPDDFKGNNSEGANVARGILKQSRLIDIDLTKTNVSKGMAKEILCQLLGFDINISDTDLKKAYQKAALRIHPDKFKSQSGGEAFKALTAAYSQAEL